MHRAQSVRDIRTDITTWQLTLLTRDSPEQCWHKVAQHFMGPMAKSRLEEVKKVMAQVQGEKYRWDWRKFKIAMTSMSCKANCFY